MQLNAKDQCPVTKILWLPRCSFQRWCKSAIITSCWDLSYSAIDLKHANVQASDFFIDQDVDANQLELKYDDKVKKCNG